MLVLNIKLDLSLWSICCVTDWAGPTLSASLHSSSVAQQHKEEAWRSMAASVIYSMLLYTSPSCEKGFLVLASNAKPVFSPSESGIDSDWIWFIRGCSTVCCQQGGSKSKLPRRPWASQQLETHSWRCESWLPSNQFPKETHLTHQISVMSPRRDAKEQFLHKLFVVNLRTISPPTIVPGNNQIWISNI